MTKSELCDEQVSRENAQTLERRRLAALRSYDILDTSREPEFDDIAQMAAKACGTPIAYVGFLDAHRQWFKAEVGYGVRELPHPPTICADTVDVADMLYLPDLTASPAYADSIFVTERFGFRFYAGVPLRTSEGLGIGTLCVIDRVPRELDEQQLFILRALARTVMAQLEMRKALIAQRSAEARLRESEDHFRHTVEMNPQVPWTCDPQGSITSYSQRWLDLTGQKPGEPDGSGWAKALHPDDLPATVEHFSASLASGEPVDVNYRILVASSGQYRWMRARALPRRNAAGEIVRWYGVVEDVHEKKVAEARLRDSEVRYRSLFDSIDIGFCIIEFLDGPHGPLSDYVHIEANAAYAQHAGIPNVVGQKVRDMVPDEAESWVARYRHVLETGEPVRFQQELIATGRQLELAAFRVEPAESRQVAVLFQDITGRLAAERRATDNERELRLIADALPVLIAFIDAGGVYRFANAAYNDWFLLPPEQIVGRNMRDIPSPVPFAQRRAYIERALAGEEVRYEIPWPHADGSHRDAAIHYLPRRTPEGETSGMHVFVQDITARKQVEVRQAALNAMLEQQVEARTRERDQIWKATTDLFAVSSLDGFLLSINPAWQRVLGWSEAELKAVSFIEFVHEDDRAATEASSAALARGEPQLTFENRYRRKDGAYRWFSWNAVPRDGLIYATARDITELKEQAEVLKKTEAALRQSQKMEAVGQLTGGIAHDFNNLLTGITGSLEMLNARVAQGRLGDIDRYSTAAHGAAKRAAALIQRLLAFSRRQTLDPKPTDVNRLIAGMEDLVRRTVGPTIRIELVAAGGLWPTLIDPPQLESALLNLCINARDAMPDGGAITIETANRWLDQRTARDRDLEPGQYISLCVSDTGTGMAPDVIEKAFDPFFTTKPLGQGTGLGLSMIYGFVRQSGGQVRIYSEVGQGSNICIYLPRHVGSEDEPAPIFELTETPRARAGETVLVVDDEPTVRMLVAEVLEELGYAAIEAADGAAGLRVLQSDVRIDLVVSDVGLPGGMNGRQMVDAARIKRPTLKVLFITGYAENAVVGNGHLAHGMHVMTKPFDMDALAARIKELILN